MNIIKNVEEYGDKTKLKTEKHMRPNNMKKKIGAANGI